MSITSPYAAHDSGFLARRKTSPIGISGAIALHVGLAAVILSMPGMPIGQHVFPPPFVTHNVPLDKPPPERIRPTERQKTTQTQTIDHPDTIFPLPYPTNVIPLPRDPNPGPVDPGPVQTVYPPPVHKPLFTESRMDPRYARNLQPDYPPARLREEEEGKVTVRVRIGADGRVLSIEQVTASHPDFWRATQVQALKAWRFIPATRDGVPVESERVMTVYFQMQGQ